ncbi:hypothetical protein BJX63DRAFT_436450 [Aspergillus granulosus]|uniref:Uncharacterized protein n=1 Tax=Aspergillus granulosus TaxID=176169 RepID=A0ABR4GZP2_9EURO
MSQSSFRYNSTSTQEPSKSAPIGCYGLGFVQGPTGRLHKAAGEVLSVMHCSRLIEVVPETPGAEDAFKPAGITHFQIVSRARSGNGAYFVPKGDIPVVGEMSFGYWTDDDGCFRLGYGRVVKVWKEFAVRFVDPFKAPRLSGEVLKKGYRKVRVFSEKGDVYKIQFV